MAILWVGALGICALVPGLTAAATDSLPAPEGAVPLATDVALHDGGVLIGQVKDSGGVAQAAVRVSLQTAQGEEVFTAVTNQQGEFQMQGVRPGVYQVVTPHARGLYRLWAPDTAPMSAKPVALVVGATVRGSLGDTILEHPLITAAVVCGVATAITLPIVLTSQHKSS
jgi:hypothetical protein